MTKTLTEQWREGTLPEGCYYVKFYTAKTPYIEVCGSGWLQELAEFNGTDRAEVLAPVPSYDEYKRLVSNSDESEMLKDFCELLLVGEKQEWERIVKRGNRKEMAKWLNERKNKTVDKLAKKLAIATKALKKMAKDNFQCAKQALEEIELRR